MKIYTKTGDHGETSLYGGKRVVKTHFRVKACGFVDELNSILGIVMAKLKNRKIETFISDVQKDLLLIGSSLAGAPVNTGKISLRVKEMENMIDAFDKELPGLTNFILPEGTEASCFLFFARTVTRRTEREIVALAGEETVDGKIIAYFNRLSDLLFVTARYLNYKAGISDTVWKDNKN